MNVTPEEVILFWGMDRTWQQLAFQIITSFDLQPICRALSCFLQHLVSCAWHPPYLHVQPATGQFLRAVWPKQRLHGDACTAAFALPTNRHPRTVIMLSVAVPLGLLQQSITDWQLKPQKCILPRSGGRKSVTKVRHIWFPLRP